MRVLRFLPLAGLFLAFAGGGVPPVGNAAPTFDPIVYTGKKPQASHVTAAVPWCGTGESATNRAPEVELSSTDQIHVVYAIPSDGADGFGAYASPIASDAEAIDGWYRGQDPSRTPRFDLFAFPGCASRFGMLDISVVRLPQSSSYYGVDLGTRMQRLTTDMRNRLGPRMKLLVYYDGPVPEPEVCGTAWNIPLQGTNGMFDFAFVWLRSQCPQDVGQGGFAAVAAIHELTHNLGAFFNAGAPHECPDSRGHACDSTSDLMYPAGTPSTRLATVTQDVGRDDYYGHSNAALVDVQDSTWLTRLPQNPLTIAVSSKGGGGAVTMSRPATGFSCASSCTATLDNGAQVALAAQPAKNSRLTGWQGACTGAGGCTLTMDGAKSVTAIFGPVIFTLSVSVTGKGHVTSTPAGLSCPKRCSHSFESGQNVRLKAKPAKGYSFTGWSGSCRGKNACTLVADRNRSARASFKRKRS